MRCVFKNPFSACSAPNKHMANNQNLWYTSLKWMPFPNIFYNNLQHVFTELTRVQRFFLRHRATLLYFVPRLVCDKPDQHTHAHDCLNLCETHTPNLPTENILQQMLCQEPLTTSGLWARQDLANWKYHISIHLVRIYGKKEPWAELWHGFSVKCVSPKLMARACSYTTYIIYIYIYAYIHIYLYYYILCVFEYSICLT